MQISQFWRLLQNTLDRVAYKQKRFISHSTESGKSNIKAPTDSLSGESLLHFL